MFIAELNHPNLSSYNVTSLRTGLMGMSLFLLSYYYSIIIIADFDFDLVLSYFILFYFITYF